VANSAAAKNAAPCPNSRPAAAHSNAVAPSMNTSDSALAPASPAALSAAAPSGGYSTGAPENHLANGGIGLPCS